MIYCRKCGREMPEDSIFCPSCGTPIATTKKATTKPEKETTPSVTGGTMLNVHKVYGAVDLQHLPEGYMIDERYKVLRKLGQGSFGAVYLAYDEELGVNKALKVIPEAISNDLTAMASLKKEAAIMVKLNHKNIVRVYDFHHKGDIRYIDMEYLEGKSLDLLKLENPHNKLPEEAVKQYALQIAEGLRYAHNKKVIHKDIKPQNILLTKEGEIKLMDFGIAETVHSSMSRLKNTGSSGTLVYMSPEQLRGKEVGKEADIYSLGATLYELLSGHPPFHQGDITYQIINEKPQPVAGVSQKMNSIVMKCLEKERNNRFRNCEELAERLKQPDKVIETKEKPKITDREKETTGQNIYPKNINKKPISQVDKKKKYTGLIVLFSIILILIVAGYFLIIPSRAKVTIESTPPGAKLYVDNVYKGETPLTVALTYGNHPIKLINGKKVVKENITISQNGKNLFTYNVKQFFNYTETTDGLNIEMVFVKGGTFQMGSPDGVGDDDEHPQHTVTVSDFYIDKYEVTQKQWKAVMGNNPSHFKGDNLPVEQVSWDDVQEFIKKLNQKTGKYYRLPTEDEWEYAARGGNRSKGYKYSGSNNIGDVAWYYGNSDSKTHPVGTKQPNKLGIYDMSGNVWEWCSDWYGSNYYGNSPQGPSSGSGRVDRGGGWGSGARLCRVADRDRSYPDFRVSGIGFRLALVP